MSAHGAVILAAFQGEGPPYFVLPRRAGSALPRALSRRASHVQMKRVLRAGRAALRACDFFEYWRKPTLQTQGLTTLKWPKSGKSHKLSG